LEKTREVKVKQRIIGLIQTGGNPSTILHTVRTAIAAVISLLLARLLGLPESYWAPISALIVTQSTWGASLPISIQRFAGTAFGTTVGAIVATFFPGDIIAYGLGIFVIGVLCTLVRADWAAFRYAGIGLSIVTLIPHIESPVTVAIHRFAEVSLGIVVGLAVTAVWPEGERKNYR
jgi:uncharacterized membrane protein YccC